MAFGYLRRDESGHWYLIPEEHIEEHDELLDQIADMEWDSIEQYDAIDEYEKSFGKYRTSGIYDLRVIMGEE